jgi:hypothetical protein
MTNDEGSPNALMTKETKRPLSHSCFVIAHYLFRFLETAVLLIPVTRECSFRKS